MLTNSGCSSTIIDLFSSVSFYSTSQTQKLMQANQGAVHPEYRVIKCACRWLTKIFLSWLSYLINPTGLDHNVSKIPSVTWCGSSNFIYDQLTWENKQLTILTAFLTLTADLNDWSAENIIKQLCTLFFYDLFVLCANLLIFTLQSLEIDPAAKCRFWSNFWKSLRWVVVAIRWIPRHLDRTQDVRIVFL